MPIKNTPYKEGVFFISIHPCPCTQNIWHRFGTTWHKYKNEKNIYKQKPSEISSQGM